MSIPNDEYQSETDKFIKLAREFLKRYEEGRKEGREHGGIAVVRHVFERQLARPLTADECENLLARLCKEGGNHLIDMALDLSPADLAASLISKDER